METNELSFKIIDRFFKDNSIVGHHLNSCNLFYEKQIKKVFMDMNPIDFMIDYNSEKHKHMYNSHLYIGKKDGSGIYYGKPIIYDKNGPHYMYPNEARLRNMTYGVSIHVDVEVEYKIYDTKDTQMINPSISTFNISKMFLGVFPIMIQSDLCILKNMTPQMRYNVGECKNDYGGYFIIDGKEKALIPQEKFANNVIYTRKVNDDKHDFSVEIRSVSEDTSKPRRTLAIRRVQSVENKENNNFLVSIPNVRKPIPLFILMRALGIESDKDICRYILGDLKQNDIYLELLKPSIYDSGLILNQALALEFISGFTKTKTNQDAQQALSFFLLPHIGSKNFKNKAYYLGHMVLELLKVITGKNTVTDRDNYKYKRVDTSGYLMYELFSEYAQIMYHNVYQKIEKELYYNRNEYISKIKESMPKSEINITESIREFTNEKNFKKIIESKYFEYFAERDIEKGFQKAFKGNWGAYTHTKRLGSIQDLNRLSYNSFISHLRKINLSIDSSAKVVGPHLIQSSQWGYIDPADTPDGGNVGLHKHMTITANITTFISIYDVINWIKKTFTDPETKINSLDLCVPEELYKYTKLMINGVLLGVIMDPLLFKNRFVKYRRLGFISHEISIHLDIESKILYIYSDEGRMIRPVFFFDAKNNISYNNKKILDDIETGSISWDKMVGGFLPFEDKDTLFKDKSFIKTLSKEVAENSFSIIEYLDTSETEGSYIAMSMDKIKSPSHRYTHCEIHPSLILGVMGNQVIFPEQNPQQRNLFSCGQSKQAASLYHSNFNNRIDKMGVVLNYGENPLLKSRYYTYLHNNSHPYGTNVVVAILSNNGYNVEDSIMINKASVERGLFRITYYNMYETFEESENVGGSLIDKKFKNISKLNLSRTKPGYDYNYLDENGIVKENTRMNDKITVIGKVIDTNNKEDEIIDDSIFPKKGQLGYVDKTYLSDGDEGKRIAKVRIREDRMPMYGDKFCSRCAQKGTVGAIVPEENMPFSKNGIRPDIIINPHALPSRMTIGQIVEMLVGKLCLINGCHYDSTPFVNKGNKCEIIGNILTNNNYQSKGNEVLYNGLTGEQIETDVFIGPTYYMRLKQMVKDKINYRARGPREMLTRQTNHGRANDGGLRVGEMERDSIVAHGMSAFVKDSMMNRGDAYKVVICNHSGTIAIHNKETNQLYSPSIDGPIKYDVDYDNNYTPQIISRFGKQFTSVEIPYSFKLLIQELMAMNVQMRLITDSNINILSEATTTKLTDILSTNRDMIKPENTVTEAYKPLINPEKIKTNKIKKEIKPIYAQKYKQTVGGRNIIPFKDIELWVNLEDDDGINNMVSTTFDETGFPHEIVDNDDIEKVVSNDIQIDNNDIRFKLDKKWKKIDIVEEMDDNELTRISNLVNIKNEDLRKLGIVLVEDDSGVKYDELGEKLQTILDEQLEMSLINKVKIKLYNWDTMSEQEQKEKIEELKRNKNMFESGQPALNENGLPSYFPDNWNYELLREHDLNDYLNLKVISESLKLNPIPNNLEKIVKHIVEKKKNGVTFTTGFKLDETQPEFKDETAEELQDSPPYKPEEKEEEEEEIVDLGNIELEEEEEKIPTGTLNVIKNE